MSPMRVQGFKGRTQSAIVMVEPRGGWSASSENTGYANTVLSAVSQSGQLYQEAGAIAFG